MHNVLDTLIERGFVQQVSDEGGLRRALEQPIRLYCGYDPTSSSLTAGNLVTIMMLAQFQRHGHQPIVLAGGGTGMIGDPSGKTVQRRIMSPEEIQQNLDRQRQQFGRYLDFSEGGALLLDNAGWLLPLRYIEFLRDIGRYFSVNYMLTTEAYRTRLESSSGLSFIEFNYMLLQSYDFLHLFRTHSCVLQVGGSDQWANCLAGADLIRRVEGAEAFVLVSPLITTASGQKMGKSEEGAIYLDPERTSPYQYYQFWINADDRDVERFLALFTFLPMHQVRELGSLRGAEIRRAKEVLAFEATALTHGHDAAQQTQAASRALFSGDGEAAAGAPTTRLAPERLHAGVSLVDLLVETGLASSKGTARKLIQQGGAYVNGARVDAPDMVVGEAELAHGELLLRAGKKRYHRVLSG